MRSLESASTSWHEIKECQSLDDLKNLVRLNGRTSAATVGLRSACWKAFLLFESVETEDWPRTLLSSRSAYNSLRLHFLRYADAEEDEGPYSENINDGLESIPQRQSHKDAELRAEILQDVERCMPENLYFRQPETQKMLLDVLFIYCKLNPDIGYRQGMHELLAPLIWVVERDAIELGPSSKAMGEDAVIKTVFDADYIEHDAFALFAQVMQSAKGFYEQTTHAATDNPIVARSRHIFTDLLPLVDQELASHLHDIEIVPQVFLIRWIRLLFGREFAYDDMLTVWDIIFAEDTSLNLVNEICLTMLLRIRWDLINADYNTALTLLLRYPPLDQEQTPQGLALDALYLRHHMYAEGGSYVVLKYTGRPIQPKNRPLTPPALQRNITTFSGENALRAISSASPLRVGRQQRGVEALFQSTAKNIYARSESLGISKVVRSAVDEVHKKAQEIREAQVRPNAGSGTPRTPSSGPAAVFARLKALEARNVQLAKLLEGAVGELWEYQKSANDTKEAHQVSSEPMEKLGIAIAKLQFVQVYLADPSLSLPPDEVEAREPDQPGGNGATEEGKDGSRPMEAERRQPEDAMPDSRHSSRPKGAERQSTIKQPPSIEEGKQEVPQGPETPARPSPDVCSTDPSASLLAPTTTEIDTAPIPTNPSPSPAGTVKVRPALEQSSFSWMLGDNEARSTPAPRFDNSNPVSESGRRRGFLFGDGEEESETGTVVFSPKRRPGKGARHKKVASVSTAGEDAFDVAGAQTKEGAA